MDRYDAVRDIATIHAVLRSVSNGDDAATEENYVCVSAETVCDLLDASERLEEYILQEIRETDKEYA